MQRMFVSILGLSLATAGLALAQGGESPRQQRGAADQPQKGAPESKPKDQKKEPVVVTLTTVTLAEGTGCWARIYDDEGFAGRVLTLVGEQSLANLEFGEGYDWEGDIDSIEVGPKARLVLYEDENFTDKRRELKANERVADLHKQIFSEGVESLTLSCTES